MDELSNEQEDVDRVLNSGVHPQGRRISQGKSERARRGRRDRGRCCLMGEISISMEHHINGGRGSSQSAGTRISKFDKLKGDMGEKQVEAKGERGQLKKGEAQQK